MRWVVVVVVLAAACDSRPPSWNCDDSTDCTDQVCVECICRDTCIDDYECASEEACQNGACMPRTSRGDDRTSDGASSGDGVGDEGGDGGDQAGDQGCQCRAGLFWWGNPCGANGTERRTCTNGCDWDAIECFGDEPCVANETPEVSCGDSADNDCDRTFDCADPDCLDQSCGDATAEDCSEPDTCDSTGACNANHLAAGSEGGCPTCEDCDGAGECANVTAGQQDNGCNAAASSNGCSGADTCSGGACQPNHAASGTEGSCATCKDCNGSGACSNVTNGHQDAGCNGTCDRCQGGGCTNNEVTCWHDGDGDGWSTNGSTTMCAPCGGNYPLTSRSSTLDCNDSKGEMNPGAGYSSSPRDCNGSWDCDCSAGIQQDRAEVFTSCNPTGSCPSMCSGSSTSSCGATGFDHCAGCSSCDTGSTVSIGCK